jgi:catechol-2,3-dioxygenase
VAESAHLSSVVVHVHDLDRSIEFYCQLLGFEVTLREEEGALLEGSSDDHMYLRLMPHGVRSSVGVGVHYTIWTLESEDAFRRAEQGLEERGALVRRHQYEGMTALEGRDPDNLSILVAHPAWRDVHPREIFSGIFNY